MTVAESDADVGADTGTCIFRPCVCVLFSGFISPTTIDIRSAPYIFTSSLNCVLHISPNQRVHETANISGFCVCVLGTRCVYALNNMPKLQQQHKKNTSKYGYVKMYANVSMPTAK